MFAPLLLAVAAVAPGVAFDGQMRTSRGGDWEQTLSVLAIVTAGAPLPNGQVHDPRRSGDWQQAYDGRRDGSLLPLREIERRVVPTMGDAQYLGVEMDAPPVYTLKFLRDGHVIWVDVDGRSGQIIRRTGR